MTDLGEQPVTVGRYLLHRQIARGGMATIHIARLLGDIGFTRIVAAKRLHAEFANDPEFVTMFLDEARIASKLHHRNVVPVLDVVTSPDEVVLIQEFVYGVPLHWLVQRARHDHQRVPVDIAVSIACQVLAGLHAAHELVDELGNHLEVVHRDVSPQNVMVAIDGTARLLDFGIAKASMSAHVTRQGMYKGKLAYSAPEQLRGRATRQSDLYSLSVVLWEMLVGRRLHVGQSDSELIVRVMQSGMPTILQALAEDNAAVGTATRGHLEALNTIVMKGLAPSATDRFATATEMEAAIASVVPAASPSHMAAWVKHVGKDYLDKHDRVIAAEETSWRRLASLSPQASSQMSRCEPLPVRPSLEQMASPPRSAYEPQQAPSVALLPEWKGQGAIVAVLAALIIAALAGIILVARNPAPSETPLTATAVARPVIISAPAAREPTPVAARVERRDRTVERPVTQPVERPVDPPPAAVAPTVPTPATAPRTTPSPPRTITAPPRTAPAPSPRKPVVREMSRPQPRVKTELAPPPLLPAKATPAPPPPAKAESPAASCNPPYYFKGSKKLFKPACL